MRNKIKNFIDADILILSVNTFVVIDETVIVRRKYNLGRIVDQQWLFGAIERNGVLFY